MFPVLVVVALLSSCVSGSYLTVSCPNDDNCFVFEVSDLEEQLTTAVCTVPARGYSACALSGDGGFYCILQDPDSGFNTAILVHYKLEPISALNHTCVQLSKVAVVEENPASYVFFESVIWSSNLGAFVAGQYNSGEDSALGVIFLNGTYVDLAVDCQCKSDAPTWVAFGTDEEVLFWQCEDSGVSILSWNMVTHVNATGPATVPVVSWNEAGATYNPEDDTVYVLLSANDKTGPCFYALDQEYLNLTIVSCTFGLLPVVPASNLGGFTYMCTVPDSADCGTVCGTDLGDCLDWQTCSDENVCKCSTTAKTTCTTGYECGVEDDGCGVLIECGTCGTDEACAADNTCVNTAGVASIVPSLLVAGVAAVLASLTL